MELSREAPPVAPLTFRFDAGQSASGYLLRADPVHLRADQSVLRLFDASTFRMEQHEADALVDTFNSFYAGQGLHLLAPCPQRWYLALDKPPGISTTGLLSVGGQDIDACLPQGTDAENAWCAAVAKGSLNQTWADLRLTDRIVLGGGW